MQSSYSQAQEKQIDAFVYFFIRLLLSRFVMRWLEMANGNREEERGAKSLHAVVDKGLTICLSKDVELELICSESEKGERTLRLHQFVCNAFRSESNVAENGAGKRYSSL
jgi:hypothetical protein